MSLPSGVSTCLVTFGPFTDHTGEPLEGSVTITASTPIRHLASGQVLFKRSMRITLDQGTGDIELPHVDQDGFVDGSGGAITLWSYRAIIRLDDGEDLTPFSFQTMVGQNTLDLGQLVPITPATGVVIPQIVVLSVNGQTGNISVPSLTQLDTVTNAAAAAHDLAQSATSSAQAAAAAVAALEAGLGPVLTEDPDHPGLYLITTDALQEDPDHPGLYLIGA